MIEKMKSDSQTRMQKSIRAFEDELSRVRTGRASPSLLDGIMVNYYGNSTPLSQVATVVVEGALSLTVKPWEKQMVQEVDKAIRNSDLGLNPATTGDIIRVPLPPLSEERRKELIRHVKNEAESAKVAIRNIRRDVNQQFKDLTKDKEITEDEERRGVDDIQKITNKFVSQVDEIVAKKEKDLLAI